MAELLQVLFWIELNFKTVFFGLKEFCAWLCLYETGLSFYMAFFEQPADSSLLCTRCVNVHFSAVFEVEFYITYFQEVVFC